MSKREKHVLIDLFCGGGGTSTGMMMALAELNADVSDFEMIAVNHWGVAIDTHYANHPHAAHHRANLAEIGDPGSLIQSRKDRRVKLMWASPECTHHSRARGGKPANDQSRASANLVLDWLDKLNVETLMIENVREFTDWGPLGVDGRPLKSKKGVLFQHWLAGLKARGYRYEWRVLNCADYGAPTTRQRFFLIATKGNRPIVWPEQTHIGPAERKRSPLFGAERKPWVPARDIIDWSDLGKDIFTGRKKPLADNTMERIRAGARRFWGVELDVAGLVHGKLLPLFVDVSGVPDWELAKWKHDAPAVEFRLLENFVGLPVLPQPPAVVKPFTVDLHGTGTVKDIDAPVQTLAAQGNHVGVVSPVILPHRTFANMSVDDPDLPLRTVTANSSDFAVAQPYAVHLRGRSTAHPVSAPLQTVTGVGHDGIVSPMVVEMRGDAERRVRTPEEVVGTMTCNTAGFAIAQAFLAPNFGERDGQQARVMGLDEPAPTVTSRGCGNANLAQPALVQIDQSSAAGIRSVGDPLPTQVTKHNQAVASPVLVTVNHGVNAGETHDRRVSGLDEPLKTVTGSLGTSLVSPFIAEYYGTQNMSRIDQPLPTLTTRDRFALVTMRMDEVLTPEAFPVGAVVYQLQILFRMLRLAECARAQSFPDGYKWTGTAKEQQIQVGNAVPPQMAKALAMATLGQAVGRPVAMGGAA